MIGKTENSAKKYRNNILRMALFICFVRRYYVKIITDSEGGLEWWKWNFGKCLR